MSEIVNKVANSKLVQIDLAQFYPTGKRVYLDISQWLVEGFLLREKEFRATVKNHDWEQYQDQHLAIYCSTDAIIPSWAYLLIALAAEPFASTIVQGKETELETVLFERFFNDHDFTQYQDQMLIVKGCGNLPIPTQAYVTFMRKTKPFAKSIMFGEPCSAVPLYKAPKK
jgi:hypothetical protein